MTSDHSMLRIANRGALAGLLLAASAGLCSAQIPFFSPPSSQATVAELRGQVSVFKNSYPWALSVGATIQPQQMIVTGSDGWAKFQVSDGSTFEVYPDSKVIFRQNSSNLKDLVDMLVGRIRVHIEKIGGQPNPNSIKTPTAVISVRGTIFDVIVEDDDITTVAVTEGLVAVRHSVLPGRDKLVAAGEVLRVSKYEPLAQKNVDRGIIAERLFRSIQDAVVTVMRQPRGGTGGGGVPGTSGPTGPVGDTEASPPPPPAPPPPPPNP
jgi:hypothetical protein